MKHYIYVHESVLRTKLYLGHGQWNKNRSRIGNGWELDGRWQAHGARRKFLEGLEHREGFRAASQDVVVDWHDEV
jgi:hypothetical protein